MTKICHHEGTFCVGDVVDIDDVDAVEKDDVTEVNILVSKESKLSAQELNFLGILRTRNSSLELKSGSLKNVAACQLMKNPTFICCCFLVKQSQLLAVWTRIIKYR